MTLALFLFIREDSMAHELDVVLGPEDAPVETPKVETPVEETTPTPEAEPAEAQVTEPEPTPAEPEPQQPEPEAPKTYRHSLADISHAIELSGGHLTKEAIEAASPDELQQYITFQQQRQQQAKPKETEPEPDEPLGELDPDMDPVLKKRLLKAEQVGKDNAELRKQLQAIRDDMVQRDRQETFSAIDSAVDSLPEEMRSRFGEQGKRTQPELKRLQAVLAGTGVDFDKIKTLPRSQFNKLVRQSYEEIFGVAEKPSEPVAQGEVKRVTKQQLAAGATAKPTAQKRDEEKHAQSVSMLDLILDS